MKIKLIIFVLLSFLCCTLCISVSVSAEASVDLEKLKEYAADGSVHEITLTNDIDLNGENITFHKNITLNGKGFTLRNGTVTLDRAEGSTLADLVIENAVGDAITVQDSPNVKLQKIAVIGSQGYSIVCRSLNERTTLTVNISLKSYGNAKGCILLEDNSLFTLNGSTAVLDIDDYVFVEEAKEQAYIGGDYRDKNFDKNDKINIFCVTSQGLFIKRESDKINLIEYEKGGTNYQCYLYPYDEEAPVVAVIKAPSTAVVHEPLDLKSAVEIYDNKSSIDEMTIHYTVTAANGSTLDLTDSTDVFVNGSVFTPEYTGMICVKAEVYDEYGNTTVRYVYIEAVKKVSVKPVISAGTIAATQTVGQEVPIPAFTAVSSEGKTLSVQVKVIDREGRETAVEGSKYVFTEAGAYRVEVSATDEYGNTQTRKYFVSAVAGGGIPVISESGKENTALVTAIAVAAVLAAGLAAAQFAVRKKK